MKNYRYRFVLAMVVAFALFSWAEKQEFKRYQTIIDRQMFGPLPPNFDPTKSPSEVSGGRASAAAEKELTKEQEQLKSAIHFSMVNITPDGSTAVGFTDNSNPKVPVHYYLKVGEERDGWLVKEADPVAATMTIAKGEVEVFLKIGGNSAKDKNATSKSGALPSNSFGARPGLGMGASLRQRRVQRQAREREALEKEKAAFRKEQAEANAKREQEKEEQAAQREEMRQQLSIIQDELRRKREEADKRRAEEKKENSESEEN